jgi:hypothetical protein
MKPDLGEVADLAAGGGADHDPKDQRNQNEHVGALFGGEPRRSAGEHLHADLEGAFIDSESG